MSSSPHLDAAEKQSECSYPLYPSQVPSSVSPDSEGFMEIPRYQPLPPREGNYDSEQKFAEIGIVAPPRVWNVYMHEVALIQDLLSGLGETIHSMLIFACFFSTVVTGFVVHTNTELEHDYGKTITLLMAEQNAIRRAAGNGVHYIPSSHFDLNPESATAHHSVVDRWMNGLFFTSLGFSLATVILAVVTLQWIRNYSNSLTKLYPGGINPQSRFMEVQKWKVGLPQIIGILPLLLHLSFALFLSGLFIYAFKLDHPTSLSMFEVMFIGFGFYYTIQSFGYVRVLLATYISCLDRVPFDS